MWDYKVEVPPGPPTNAEEREQLRVWLEEQAEGIFELAELNFDPDEPFAVFKRRRSPAQDLFRGKR